MSTALIRPSRYNCQFKIKFVNFEAKLKQSPSCQNLSSVVNLIKHFTIVIYDSRVI